MPMTIPGAGFKIIVTGQIVAGLPVYVPTFPMSGAVNLVVKLDPMSAPVKTLMYEVGCNSHSAWALWYEVGCNSHSVGPCGMR